MFLYGHMFLFIFGMYLGGELPDYMAGHPFIIKKQNVFFKMDGITI